NLYAGGDFSTAGDNAANLIAKWDGSSWSALSSGMGGGVPTGGGVHALAVSGSNLYAGRNFTTAGGNAANRIAKWNGSSWSALGSGIGGVRALVMLGSDMYAGGYLTMAGGKVSTYIARARIGSIARSLVAANPNPYIEFSGVTGYQYDV